MATPRFEIPAGVIDDVNTVFTVGSPYLAGSVAVFLNGQLLTQVLDDGWTETDPATGVVTLNEAPRVTNIPPDVVQIFYLVDGPVLPEGQIMKLTGILSIEGKIVCGC